MNNHLYTIHIEPYLIEVSELTTGRQIKKVIGDLPMYRKNMKIGTLRKRVNTYKYANDLLGEVFPISNTSKSITQAYHEYVMYRQECPHGTKWYAAETYCYRCSEHVVTLEIDEAYARGELKKEHL